MNSFPSLKKCSSPIPEKKATDFEEQLWYYYSRIFRKYDKLHI